LAVGLHVVLHGGGCLRKRPHLGGVAFCSGFFVVNLSLGFDLFAPLNLFPLKLGWGTIEDVNGFNAQLNEVAGAVK
jgi:hypothetical protein